MRNFLSFFFSFFIFSGCTIQGITANNAQHLTPQQIKALADAQQNYQGCSMVGGPPIGGRSVFLFYPHDKDIEVKFGPDCQILNQ